MKQNDDFKVRRIGGYLYKVIPIFNKTGKLVSHAVTPLMVEFRPRDLLQIIIGASALAVPVSFTEEVWNLGAQLPFANILLIAILSMLFIGSFVYFNFYRFHFKENIKEYFKRVIAIYLVSLIVAGGLLTLIAKCPWGVANLVAIKRIIIVAFPASMSATLSDTIK